MVGSYGVVTVELGQGVPGYTGESDAGRVVKCNNMQQLCPVLAFALPSSHPSWCSSSSPETKIRWVLVTSRIPFLANHHTTGHRNEVSLYSVP